MKPVKPILISGSEVWPIVEGGKGVAVSNGRSAGAFAAAGCVGTFSAVNADSYDEDGNVIPQTYSGKTRRDRFEELIAYAVRGGIAQARIAHDVSQGRGRLHLNVLWEAGGTERVLEGVLEGAKGLVHGVTCGAGMPYRVSEIVSRYGVYYYPIVSSARALKALWKRSYHKHREFLGGVVYEDPWLAGGHNGLSNSEDPRRPEPPFARVVELRATMREFGLDAIPIFMAGGVWSLKEWEDWIDNPDLGPVAFQFGTRPLLTRESPICEAWKRVLLNLKPGDVSLNRFSPTGFYSSAVRNAFLRELEERNARQVPYAREPEGVLTEALPIGARGRQVFLEPQDVDRAKSWMAAGFTDAMRTPDSTLIFVAPDKATRILKAQQDCMGCLSACRFSNWSQSEDGSTGKPADPRSFCIQKTLQSIAHGGDIDNNLMFSGHNAYRFATDPLYRDGFIPTVQQLVERILAGE
ncbi:MAG: nitronate monooxygenase [Magnetospirillum sp. WYHS-4]